ncbi:MAG: AAA family ATPase [Bacteroidales bacterium]|nr:AAA family ATPase [Bacteroidales bacterium]
MNIELIRLRINHFKGIKSLEVNFSQVTNIRGDNATGKTTIMDAFLWLLFGKDSTDRRDFEVKHISNNGNGSPKNVEVEGLLIVDNKRIILKRVFAEKWIKKRGSSEAEFSGHETTLFYNEVPVTVREYQEKIDAICSEDVFKMITSPYYFNSLHWEVQRKILFEMAGNDVTDESVARGKPEFESLLRELTGKNLVEYRKQVANQKRRIKSELDLIPTRIDEVNRSLPKEQDWTELNKQLQQAQSELQSIEDSITDKSKAYQQQFKERTELQKKIHQAKEKLADIVAAYREEHLKGYRDILAQNARVKSDMENVRKDILHRENRMIELKRAIADNVKSRETLREVWHLEQSRQFSYNETVCPACKRPFDDVETRRVEMLEAFNLAKFAKIAKIADQGRVLKSEHQQLVEQAESIKEQVLQLQGILTGLGNELQQVEEPALIAKDIPGYIEAAKQIDAMEDEYRQPMNQPDIAELKKQKYHLQSVIGELKDVIAWKDQIDKGNTRINDLKQQQQKLAQELASLEKTEFVMQNFEKAKANAIEEKVSGMFELVKWRLFEKQINGQEVSTCKATYKRVPYTDLNSAAKAIIGLDIINTLSRYYDVSAPIFIDNREGINQLIPTQSQLINLSVSKDPELVIET